MATRTTARVEPASGAASGESICVDTYEISDDVTLTMADDYDKTIINLTAHEARALAAALVEAANQMDSAGGA